jgi:hypothetical protein
LILKLPNDTRGRRAETVRGQIVRELAFKRCTGLLDKAALVANEDAPP